MAQRKLGMKADHRKATLRTMVTQFFDNERMETTTTRAKEMRKMAEKLITLGKEGSLHSRRQAEAVLTSEDILTKLFDDIAPRYTERDGGYTRITRVGPRRGDAAELAIVELV